jgi:hypothetical protein
MRQLCLPGKAWYAVKRGDFLMLHWIAYDLDKPGQDYTDLIARLKELNAVRILKSDWLLENSASPEAIRNDLQRFMDSNDRIMVSEVYNNAAWRNLLANGDTVKAMYARSARNC